MIVFTQETANCNVDAQIFQHFSDVDTFTGGVQASGFYQIHFTTFDLRAKTHQIVSRV
ncbi:hypothetical protein D3C71_2221070 [compost metagenome]